MTLRYLYMTSIYSFNYRSIGSMSGQNTPAVLKWRCGVLSRLQIWNFWSFEHHDILHPERRAYHTTSQISVSSTPCYHYVYHGGQMSKATTRSDRLAARGCEFERHRTPSRNRPILLLPPECHACNVKHSRLRQESSRCAISVSVMCMASSYHMDGS